MKLLEYEAKQLFDTAGIETPASELVQKGSLPALALPFALKSQVATGGRGKAGGVVIIDNAAEIEPTVARLFRLPIKGLLPKMLLTEEKLAITRELYLSLMVDRTDQTVVLMAHTQGGVEIEEHTADSFLRIPLAAEPDFATLGQSLADYYNAHEQLDAFTDLLKKLFDCFLQNDALLLEINPLIVTEQGKLVAGDAKMTLDDAASFRHPDWQSEFKEAPAEANFVTLDPSGNVATIANGAGLAMATVDAVADAGLLPANFLDIGGGANTETLLAAFHRLVDYPQLCAIIINIFAGITRADEVAHAIVAARQQISDLPPLFIRLAGTNYEAALGILQEAHIALLPSLEDCLAAAKAQIGDAHA